MRGPDEFLPALLFFVLVHVLVPAIGLIALYRATDLRLSDLRITSPFVRRRTSEVAALTLLVVILFFTYIPFANIAGAWGEHAFVEGLEQRRNLSAPTTVAVCALIALAAAFSEEVFVRALPRVLLDNLAPVALRSVVYVTFSSLLFGALHLPLGLTAAISATYLGVIAALILVWTNNLWYLFAGHFVLDVVLVYWRFETTGAIPI